VNIDHTNDSITNNNTDITPHMINHMKNLPVSSRAEDWLGSFENDLFNLSMFLLSWL
jgi:hypothetical protein